MAARVALVTGGTRGIGAAIAVALKAAGHTVAVNYASDEKFAAEFCAETGIKTYKWDVGDFEDCTRGHAAVAIRTATGWLVHAGDSYLHHGELTHGARSPLGIEFFQRLNGVDVAARRSNRARLRALALEHPEVQMFCAHDPVELERMRAGSSGQSQRRA